MGSEKMTVIVLLMGFFLAGLFVGAKWASQKLTPDNKDFKSSYKPAKCAQINCNRDAKNYGAYSHYCDSHATDRLYGM